MKTKLIMIAVLILAFALRVQGINWDSGYHFHPDERMLIMVTERVEFSENLDPDFFNYGSLPVYILAGIAQLFDTVFQTKFDSYDGLLLLGRMISTIMDLGTVVFVFLLSKLVFKSEKVGLWSAFFYSVAFFPIQNSHFFIVDTFLTFFVTALLYSLLRTRQSISTNLNQSPLKTYSWVFLVGIIYAAALTSKVTAIIFAPVIVLALSLPTEKHENIFHKLWNSIISFFRKRNSQLSTFNFQLFTIFLRLLVFVFTTVAFSFVFMPYAFLRHEDFLRDIMLQVQMNGNPYVFPYTLQYVGTTPYWYYLKNIFLWGLGPIISVFSVIGILIAGVSSTKYFVSNIRNQKVPYILYTLYSILTSRYALFALFYLLFFLIIGKSSVKFMRYMLLMYPFFAIMAGYAVTMILKLLHYEFSQRKNWKLDIGNWKFHLLPTTYSLLFMLLPLFWTMMFLSIYTRPNTRIQATDWINAHIPAGATLAVEHWDDRVPIFDPGKYQYEEMTLYDIPDNEYKWKTLNEKLDRTDYIVIASNRLYTPLMRLQDCGEHGRCYPMTKEYYEDLFAGRLGFKKVAEFTSYPTWEIGNWTLEINDTTADESFTVYDHPKIMVFERE